MNWLPRTMLGLLLLLASGCATVPFANTVTTPTTPSSVVELSGALWNSGSGKLLVRQSALFEFGRKSIPIAGIMKLDLAAKSARLVGMNEMGVKLYDISIDVASSKTNFIIPDLAAYPGFTEAVAASVRRIFLYPQPGPGDMLERTATHYQLSRNIAGGTVDFTLGGADRQILEKTFRGDAESWRVRYYQYQKQQGQLFPGGIVLDDEVAGYRLTLWIESVGKTDE